MVSAGKPRASGTFANNLFSVGKSVRLIVTVTERSACLALYRACFSAGVRALPVFGRPTGRLVGIMFNFAYLASEMMEITHL